MKPNKRRQSFSSRLSITSVKKVNTNERDQFNSQNEHEMMLNLLRQDIVENICQSERVKADQRMRPSVV